MDTRYQNTRGRVCAVIGCNNSCKTRFLWESESCQLHGKLRMFCGCPRPFKLHSFPKDSTDVSKLKRMTWISNLKRKGYKPAKDAVVSPIRLEVS